MTDRDGFLGAILANPADDLARLVYCDWLEENQTRQCEACGGAGRLDIVSAKKGSPFEVEPRYVAEPASGPTWVGCRACGGTVTEYGSGRVDNGNAARAELIRLGCEYAGSPCAALPPGQVHLVAPSCRGCKRVAEIRVRCKAIAHERTRELHEEFGQGWCTRRLAAAWRFPWTPDSDLPPDRTVTATVERGFVAGFRCSAQWWLFNAEHLRPFHPVEWVELTTLPRFDSDPSAARLPFEPTTYFLVGDPASRTFTMQKMTGVLKPGELLHLNILDALLRLRWPGIRFTLPTAPPPAEPLTPSPDFAGFL